MLILFQRILLLCRHNIGVLMAVIVASLFILGAHPIAVNLIPSPWDKLAHGGLFALLAWGTGTASGLSGWKRMLVALAVSVLIGVLDELNQLHLPGRQAGWDDLAADVIGSVAGAILPVIIGWRKIRDGR
ncbi:MAG TPA: VanZ family protein [Nitrosospira sp.]|jgi:uncharacterized protein YfiM (DUF2279 family)|nr:VanZ family protein [Nitrosospira sp.]